MSKLAQVVGLLVLLTVGLAGIFWSELSGYFAPPFSVADAKCAKLWVPRAQNDPALTCYLTENPSRLCNPDERNHLAWLMERYDSDKTAFGQDMLAALLSVQLETAVEQASNPNGDSTDALNKAEKTVAESLKSNGGKEAMSVDIVPRAELVAKIERLGEQGYIHRADFGWFPDSLVKEALDGIKSNKSPC